MNIDRRSKPDSVGYGLENRLTDLVSPLVAYKKREKFDSNALNRQFTQTDRNSTAIKNKNGPDISDDCMDSGDELHHDPGLNLAANSNKRVLNQHDQIVEEHSVLSREKSKSSVGPLYGNFQRHDDIYTTELKTDG